MQSSIFSSTLCLSLLASLAVAALNEPAQSGASQNSGVSEAQKHILLAQNTNAQTIGEAQNSGFLGTLLGTGGGGTTLLTLATHALHAILATQASLKI